MTTRPSTCDASLTVTLGRYGEICGFSDATTSRSSTSSSASTSQTVGQERAGVSVTPAPARPPGAEMLTRNLEGHHQVVPLPALLPSPTAGSSVPPCTSCMLPCWPGQTLTGICTQLPRLNFSGEITGQHQNPPSCPRRNGLCGPNYGQAGL